jgi:ATP-dependent exoDNAse (exonuclease V) beta subunit
VLLSDSKLAEARRQALQWLITTDLFPEADAASLPAWLALVDTFCTRDGPLYKRMTRSNGFPAADARSQERARRALALLGSDASLGQQLAAVRYLPGLTYTNHQWHVLESLLVVLPLAVAELQLVFQAQRQADYVEIALRALRALGTPDEPTDLALAFDGRLDHLLVDEFQDTSFAQLELLEQLTAGWTSDDGRTLFCVGDPMQSIYRFRQAEVGLFLNMQRTGLPNVSLQALRLSANFRAARPLVAWINRVFPEVLASADDVDAGAVKYSACVAALAANEGGVSVHALTTVAPRLEALKVVEIVRAALAADAEGSIAVLVSAKHHAGVICTELARAQVAFKAVEIAQLGDQTVVQDLLALVRALVHVADRTAWLAILRAPWCGLSLADLHALVGEQPQATIRQQLSAAVADGAVRLSLDGRGRALRLHTIMHNALLERGRQPLRDWVERTWNSLGGPATLHDEQELADAEAFFGRLELLEQAGDLEDVTRLQGDLASLFAKPQRQATARVEVMTIHKAKGLEFDTVILPGLHRPTRNSETELLRWTRTRDPQHGAPGIVLAPSQGQGAEADPVYQWLHKLERQRAGWERSRLLYVAATRAKRHLHLLGYAGALRDDKGHERKPRAGSMLRMLWHELAADFGAALPPASVEPLPAARVPVQRLPLEWQLPAADPATLARSGRNLDMAERLPFDWASETARHVGTLVHRELERMTRTGALPGQTAADRFDAELAELGVPSQRRRDACQRVSTAIQQTLVDPRGRWLLGLERNIDAARSELGLSGVVEGRLVSAVIDRTFIDTQGTRWIIDFKTSTHEGGGLEEFLREEVTRYRAQLTLYARLMRALEPSRPVRTALYFPLLQQWREVL